MNRFVFCLLALVVICAPAAATSQSLGPIEIKARESGVQLTKFIGKDATLYNYSWEVTNDGGRILYNAKGDNGLSGAKRIEWTEKSVMELSAKGIRTLSWAKESSGAEKQSWQLEYDWAARKMKYTWQDRVSGKKENKTVDLGPDAHASDCMHFMIRGFPFEKGPGTKISGEFVMTNGQVFPGTIIFRGEERLETAFGPIDTYKIEFKIGGPFGGLAPKMYTWYTKAAPHVFIRYEGKDAGLTKGRTVNELIKYTPSEIMAP